MIYPPSMEKHQVDEVSVSLKPSKPTSILIPWKEHNWKHRLNKAAKKILGALDGGIDIPHTEKRFAGFDKDGKQLDAEVHRKYIYGGHVASYMRELEMGDIFQQFVIDIDAYNDGNQFEWLTMVMMFMLSVIRWRSIRSFDLKQDVTSKIKTSITVKVALKDYDADSIFISSPVHPFIVSSGEHVELEKRSNASLLPDTDGEWMVTPCGISVVHNVGNHEYGKLALKMTVGAGNLTMSWKDAWICRFPLKEVFPRLYELEVVKSCLVMDDKWRWTYGIVLSPISQIGYGGALYGSNTSVLEYC
ncbi:hypothetical protein M8C21_006413 [Ambrosia artemisiifolia]|uniref:Uncharacterized protein n=1 Tax=Ambrosia artemisiifolia TaxID=4212 RepID=A0AAD5GUB5_AMBAR|nr:hypothetical protein M8C21_006413 [Ambrosia artemisiifolia]